MSVRFRLRPQRWLLAAAVVPLSAVSIALISWQQPLAGLAVGAMLGLVVGALVIAVYARGDSQYFEVAERRPNAIALQCMFGEATGWDEITALLRIATAGDSSGTFALTFEHGKMSLWSGDGEPKPILDVPYSEIADIALGKPYIRGSYRPVVYERLEILLLIDGQQLTFQFAVEEAGVPANSARLAFLADELKDALEGIVLLTDAHAPRRLINGPTAWSVRQLGVILLVVSIVLALFLVPVGVVLGGGIAPFLFALAGLAVAGAASLLLYSMVAVRRELAVGYTTLHGSHLDVEQRHPSSGRVIRRAGGAALTNDELRAALAKDAK